MTILAYILCFLCLLLGFVGGMVFTMWSFAGAVDRADICRDDQNFIRDVLGIPPLD